MSREPQDLAEQLALAELEVRLRPMTQEAIAQRLGVHRSRVQQIEMRALSKMRRVLGENVELTELLQESSRPETDSVASRLRCLHWIWRPMPEPKERARARRRGR
jgi:transcriptional regulator with XRE-family HTH domain